MRILMFTIMLLLFSNLFRINNVMHALGQCLPDQKTVLLQIRSEITYDSSASTKLVLWDETVDCCHWPGLSCNGATGYITTLDLEDDESITGGFSMSLLQKFPSLSVIRLHWVDFSAPFPDFFEDFKYLTVLSLIDCGLSGTVPQKVFQVPTLQTIDLSSNHMLGGSLPDFPENGSLKSLTLRETMFSGNLPNSIGNLRLLSHIDLTVCHFSGPIPASISGLDNLETLDLSENLFSGHIPTPLFSLPSLKKLTLSNNNFSGQINELQKVTSPLESLDLSNNNLEGTIHLAKFRKTADNMSFDFSNNNLAIETTISAAQLPLLPQFQYLRLASCNLQKFPSFLKNQPNLRFLDLSNNAISGEIPSWIWGIGNGQLLVLNLSHNHLTHMKDPMEYNSLHGLDLNSNMFSGKVPRLPPEAQYLDLSNNNFSMVPLDIADQIPNVYFFSIAKNRIGGRISTSWCRAANLQVLDLSYNALHGIIPPCLVHNNSNLVVMNLKGNHLSGEISQKFQDSCSLETLDLSQNMLEGQLPPSLVNCTELKVLNLGNNRLSDTFPCWLNILSNLHILVLHPNHFHGSISCTKLGVNNSWPSLQVIDLSSNNFSGNLPAELFLELKAILVDRNNEANSEVDYLYFESQGHNIYYQDSVSLSLKGQGFTIEKILSIFTSIDFSSNQFEGGIPESVGELKLLHLLNISHNALTGGIPQSLENLKALEALDLSFNNLAGSIPEQLEPNLPILLKLVIQPSRWKDPKRQTI